MPAAFSVAGIFCGPNFLLLPIWSMSRLPITTTRLQVRAMSRVLMFSVAGVFKRGVVALVLMVAAFNAVPAWADDSFPFGLEMTLDVAPQPGSKRLPTLEIG